MFCATQPTASASTLFFWLLLRFFFFLPSVLISTAPSSASGFSSTSGCLGTSSLASTPSSLPKVSRRHFLSLAFFPRCFISFRFLSGSRNDASFLRPANSFNCLSSAKRISRAVKPKVFGDVSRYLKPTFWAESFPVRIEADRPPIVR